MGSELDGVGAIVAIVGVLASRKATKAIGCVVELLRPHLLRPHLLRPHFFCLEVGTKPTNYLETRRVFEGAKEWPPTKSPSCILQKCISPRGTEGTEKHAFVGGTGCIHQVALL